MTFEDNFRVAGASGVIATRLDSKWRERLFLWMAARLSHGASPWQDDSTLQTRACFRRKHLFRMRPNRNTMGRAKRSLPSVGSHEHDAEALARVSPGYVAVDCFL